MTNLLRRVLPLLCLLPIPLLAVPAAAAETAAPCRLMLYASLPLKTESDGRVSVPVTIDGHDLSFLVDTGGVVATLNWGKVEEFGMHKTQSATYLIGVAGTVLSEYVKTESLSIGPLKGAGLAAYVEVRGQAPFDGTLGPDILRHFDVELDFAHGVMRLFAPNHCPEKVVYWTRGGHVEVPFRLGGGYHIRMPVTVDGKEVTATVDTGAMASFMNMRMAQSVGVAKDAPELKLKPGSFTGDKYRLYSYPFRSLGFDGVTVNNPNIIVSSNEFTEGMGNDLILGVGILRQLRVYIAYDDRKIYLTPALAN